MGKKSEDVEPKKECPSCGLGVALNATACEFCGWDFEEEDEWILQIEKLERELMLEKQKFEPGTVNHMIESTLRNPILERVDQPFTPQPPEHEPVPPPPRDDYEEIARPAPAKSRPQPAVREVRHTPPPVETRTRALKAPPPVPRPAPTEVERVAPRTRTVRAPKPEQRPAPAPVAKPTPAPVPDEQGAKRTRTVRKVKGT